MGAAWCKPKDRDIEKVAELVRAVKAEGLDTSPAAYGRIISTRTFDDRLRTLERVRDAGIGVCCGGIVGMGESRRERAGLVAQVANLEPHPKLVPINQLVRVEGTPLADTKALDPLEFVRTIAVARVTMPRARVRLSAGRREMSDAVQALCFLAGATRSSTATSC